MLFRILFLAFVFLVASRFSIGDEHQSFPSESYDEFEDVQPTWRIDQRSSSLGGIKSHSRTDSAAHSGRRSEYISLYGKRGGEQILATHTMPPSAAINELRIGLWVRGNRPGFQLMARVRLPRDVDEHGEPFSFYVYGDRYVQTGGWQELTLTGIRDKIAKALPVERISLGRHLEQAEAYVDQIALNVFGSSGLNRVWIDDLVLDAAIPAAIHSSDSSVVLATAELSISNQLGEPRGARVPRVVTHRGEPFDLLKELGFNTVWLRHTATNDQLLSASQNKLWLICPPPLHKSDLNEFDRVVAWCISHQQEQASEQPRVRLSRLRSHDPRRRPLVAKVDSSDSPELLQLVDITVRPNATGGTSGVGWSALGSPLVRSSRWWPLRQQIWDGVIDQQSGFVLQTAVRLDHPESMHARNIAELSNIEIKMLQPWLAESQLERFTDRGKGSRYQLVGLSARHSSIAFVREEQSRSFADVGHDVEILTSSHRDVFRLEPGGLSPVNYRRIAGGFRVMLDTAKPSGILLFTDRAAIIETTARYLSKIGPRANELLVDVLRVELIELDQRLQHSVADRSLRSHWRKEVHSLHDRIAPMLDPDSKHVLSFRQLDHVLGQLERVHRSIHGVRHDESVASRSRAL